MLSGLLDGSGELHIFVPACVQPASRFLITTVVASFHAARQF